MAKAQYEQWLEKDNLILLEAWARDGLTDEQIANNIGIKRQTLYTWKNKYDDISDALKRGKEIVDIEVENAMFKSAIGFEYDEEVLVKVRKPNGEEEIKIKKFKRYAQPNTTAQIFWLKNRKPTEWRDRKETEISGNISTNPMSELTADELRAIIAKDEGNDS